MLYTSAASFGVLLLLAAPGWAAEKNDPCSASSTVSDVRFELALKDHGAVFQAGEIVPLTLSFASTVKGRYTAMMANYDRSGRVHEETYCLEPDAPDPLDTYFKTRGGMGGGLRSIQPLSETPSQADVELNEWRSLPPGRYRVYAISWRVSRPREPQEDNPSPNVGEKLRSNSVDIEVNVADPAWQQEQLRAAVATLDGKPSPDEARHAARVLRFLNTPDAAREMAKRFWGLNEQGPAGWEYMFGLYGSPYRQLAIDSMRAELAAPGHAITNEFLSELVNLQVSGDSTWDSTPAGHIAEAEAFWARRRAREQELRKTAIIVVLATLSSKSSSARASTLDQLSIAAQADRELVSAVRGALIAAWVDLPGEMQQQLIQHRWPEVASVEMLPILRGILAQPPPALRSAAVLTRNAALKDLYELDPEGGRAAILKDVQDQKTEPGLDLARVLPISDLAAAAVPAAERIATGKARVMDYELVDEYADASVLPLVRAAFEKRAALWACPPHAAILRYLLRVDPEYGARAVSASLRNRGAACYRTLLSDLGTKLPAAQQSAIDALDDSDAQIAQEAASALGRWGSKDAERALWDRLRRFHAEWAGREDELRSPPHAPIAGSHGQSLEQVLVAAIAKGGNWIAPPDKLASLKEFVWTKLMAVEIDDWAVKWKSLPLAVETHWFPGGGPTYSVVQYGELTEDQLRAKLAQFPRGTKLQWNFYRMPKTSPDFSTEKQEAVYERVRADAAAHGIVVGRGVSRLRQQ